MNEMMELMEGAKTMLLMSRLSKAQDEYIKLLEDELSKVSIFADIHHYKASDDAINKGIELREQIKSIKNELPK